MAKRLTVVLIVSDDTAEEIQEWADSPKIMFMGRKGRETDLLELKVESVDSVPISPDSANVRFLPGSPGAAELLGTAHWSDSQGNVRWRNAGMSEAGLQNHGHVEAPGACFYCRGGRSLCTCMEDCGAREADSGGHVCQRAPADVRAAWLRRTGLYSEEEIARLCRRISPWQ